MSYSGNAISATKSLKIKMKWNERKKIKRIKTNKRKERKKSWIQGKTTGLPKRHTLLQNMPTFQELLLTAIWRSRL